MCFGNIEVVGLNRDSVENRRHEALALVSPAPLRQLNANLQLRHSDRRDRDVVAVVDHIGQGVSPALGINQDRRIED